MAAASPVATPSNRILRIPVPWVFVLTYLAGGLLQRLVPLPFGWTLPVSLDALGGALFVLGALIAGWGWLTFYRADTTRVPGQASTTMVTWGPYRFTRNPMYVGLTVAYLGEAALLHQAWPPLLLPLTLVYLSIVVIPLEESKLRDVFGAQYDAYRARVRRWL